MSKQTDTNFTHLQSTQNKVIVSIDLGASSGRLILGWLEEGLLKTQEIYRFENEMQFDGENYIWDINAIFEHIITGLKLLPDIHVASIGVDTWGVDYVLLDTFGNVVDKAYAYRDHRTDDIFKQTLRDWDNKTLFQITGLQFMHFNTLYQLKAHVAHNPEILKNDITLLMLPDYFHYKLSGIKINEFTDLSTSQLLDIKDRALSDQVLSYINIDKRIFPPMAMSGSILGSLTKEICELTDLSPDTQVILPASHDTASAVLASIGDSNSVYICSGTWSLMGIVTDKPVVSEKAYQHSFSNEGGAYNNTHLLKNIMGLWIINQAIKEVAPKINLAELAVIAAETPAFITLINPNDAVFFNPKSMVLAIQRYAEGSGQKVPYTLAAIARCVYDSLALLYNTILGELEDTVHRSFNSINIIGGGCKNTLLNQITADVTRKPVLAGPAETSSIGSIVLQMISLELIEDIKHGKEIIKKSEKVEYYYPRNIENLDALLARFEKICAYKIES